MDLVALASRYARRPGLHPTPLPTLQIIRADAPYDRVHAMHKPSLCFIVQGTKIVSVGDAVLRYTANQFIYSSVELPVAGEVTEATARRPYLCLVLEVDASLVFDLVSATESIDRKKLPPGTPAIVVGRDDTITEAFGRLLTCLANPVDAKVLAPTVIRELVYRLLRGPYGHAVREVGIADSQTQRIASVIERLKTDFAKTHSMAALARIAGMSVSSFHAHFKKVTTVSPLQYQKHLRLHEARRLLLTTTTSAADAGFRVGYESPSQFSREYARLFGLPPISDLRRAS
jgi:AraC-like DNA-binding protein